MASATWGHVFSGVHRSGIPPPDALASAPSEFRQLPPGGFGQRCLLFVLPRGSSVVVQRRPSSGRSSPQSLAALAVAVHRSLGFWLGCIPRRRPHFRLVVSPLFCFFDQPPKAPCGLSTGFRGSSLFFSFGPSACLRTPPPLWLT